jgi:hypothetical protein
MVASAPRSEPPNAKQRDELNFETLNIEIQPLGMARRIKGLKK